MSSGGATMPAQPASSAIVLQPAPDAAVEAFLDALQLFGLGFSWGGFESLALTADPQFDVPQAAARVRRRRSCGSISAWKTPTT